MHAPVHMRTCTCMQILTNLWCVTFQMGVQCSDGALGWRSWLRSHPRTCVCRTAVSITLLHSLLHSLAPSLLHSFTHPFTHSFTHSITPSIRTLALLLGFVCWSRSAIVPLNATQHQVTVYDSAECAKPEPDPLSKRAATRAEP